MVRFLVLILLLEANQHSSDYNYEAKSGGICELVPGLQPIDPEETCFQDKNAVEYYDPTGYRRIPLSTCQGGLNLDHQVVKPCPNKEEEFKKKHPGISGVGLFFAIFTPIVASVAIGYYVFTRWEGKLGHIRLGDPNGSGLFSQHSPVVSIPVTVISGFVAIASTIPLLFSSAWRSINGRFRSGGYQRPYSSRGAFAARRGDYLGVVDDEDELLGEDDFDEDTEA